MRRSASVKDSYPRVGKEGCLGFILLMLLITGDSLVAGGSKAPSHAEIEELLRKRNKPAIKTIQSSANEIIDCVEIHKQPAFDHPLLKNHTIETRPSFIPDMKVGGNSSFYPLAKQAWMKNGSCPEGTIPILRITKDSLHRSGSSVSYGLNGDEPRNCRVEVAGTQAHREAPYYGVTGIINIWNLLVMVNEWSLNSISAVNKQSLVESGWGVSPIMFGDSRPRLYANWRDGEKGCYNLVCPGFVQVSRNVVLGAAFDPVSTYDGRQYVMKSTIYKDVVQEKWWLMYGKELVGYWPTKLFSNLQSASVVEWLGHVCNTEDKGFHTTTQMGSGHWAGEGWGRASFLRGPRVLLGFPSEFKQPKWWEFPATYRSCYDVKINAFDDDAVPGFFYGGPGGPCCDGRC